MAITLENLFDMSCTEANGRVTTLRRAGYVQGLTSTDPADYAEDVLAAGAVPSAGSTITINGDTLYLRARVVKASDDSALGDARVELAYEVADASTDDSGTPVLEVGTTLRQVETGKDANGDPITVSYDWPDGAKGLLPDGEAKDGATHTIGGTIRVMKPTSQLRGSFNKATNTPGSFTRAYVGKVNSTTWQGDPARTWMCTRATAKLVDNASDPKVWQMDFTFEYDENTWDDETTVIYIDPETGRPPDGIDDPADNGIEIIEYYGEKDFNTDF